MAEDWAGVAADVLDAVQELEAEGGTGGTAYIVRNAESGEPDDPVLTPTEHVQSVVYSRFKSTEIDGKTIYQSDEKVLVPASGLSIVPTNADKFRKTSGGDDLVIVDVWKTSPVGVDVLYVLQVRE